MSRLESAIRRLEAQRDCLNQAVRLIGDLPGPLRPLPAAAPDGPLLFRFQHLVPLLWHQGRSLPRFQGNEMSRAEHYGPLPVGDLVTLSIYDGDRPGPPPLIDQIVTRSQRLEEALDFVGGPELDRLIACSAFKPFWRQCA